MSNKPTIEAATEGAPPSCLQRGVRGLWWPTLWKRIKAQNETIETCCRDWADDHTHLQELCLRAGWSQKEVFGDSYGVPGIQDLGDMLSGKPPNDPKLRHSGQ